MRRTITALIGGALLTVSAPLFAQPSDCEDCEEDTPAWSVGLGVALGGAWFGAGQAGSAAGIGGLGMPMLYVTTLERQLGGGTWLTLRASGSYASNAIAGADSVERSWSFGGALGVRQVLNPEDRFQVSLFGMAGPSFAGMDSVGAAQRAWDVHVQAGVALEQIFTEHIALRLSLAVLRAGYAETNSVTTSLPSPTESGVSGFDASIGLSPQLELRFYW